MKGRINYIDSAKGICILLVMMIHIGVQEPIPNIYAVKVPLFFVLSGYFIKDEILPIKVYLAKTIKRLLIPFLFFYLLSYIVYYVGCYAYPPMRELTEARGILDCITQKQYFNGTLWFLLSLFFVQITVNLVQRVTDNEWVRTIVFLLMGCSGFILSRAEIDLPIAIDTSLVAIPMFWIGHYLHRFEVFEKKGTWKYFVPACLVVYIIPIFTPPSNTLELQCLLIGIQ